MIGPPGTFTLGGLCVMSRDNTVDALRDACKGLVFISESDAALEPFQWNDVTDLTPENIIAQAGAAKGTPVECVTLDQFFRAVSKEDKPQFDNLAGVLRKYLSDIKVYKVGQTEKVVFIVGTTADGTWAGVKTSVVET
jgi:hypothetical protein